MNVRKNATKLRNNPTPFERDLWNALKSSQLGHKFRRQHAIQGCIVDFFCPAKALIVEIDGDTHDDTSDAERDARHARLGYHTIRVTNRDVGDNLIGVLEHIKSTVEALPHRWPHPNPSPEGEGL